MGTALLSLGAIHLLASEFFAVGAALGIVVCLAESQASIYPPRLRINNMGRESGGKGDYTHISF